MSERSTFRILVVEDQERHQRVYERAITDSLPATVDFAVDGVTAMTKMRADDPPDMVLLDLEIPGLRGQDVLQAIRADHRLRYTPVIILTGMSSLETQMELLDQGADDFIEKGAPPEILIARLKAQMRHKIAVDRLERVALDRDLFAAGVLQDIGTIKWTIVSLCRGAKEILARDPIGEKPALLAQLDKLTAHGTRLGAYASDVIQSVRETHRAPQIQSQSIESLLNWAVDVSASVSTEDGAPAISIKVVTPMPLKPVLADKSFLRLAIINIVQNAVQHARPGAGVTLTVTQTERAAPDDNVGRRYITTSIADDGEGAAPKVLQQIFRPAARTGESDAGFSIGMALVAKVIAKMGGDVQAAHGANGSGLVLSFSLPAAD